MLSSVAKIWWLDYGNFTSRLACHIQDKKTHPSSVRLMQCLYIYSLGLSIMCLSDLQLLILLMRGIAGPNSETYIPAIYANLGFKSDV